MLTYSLRFSALMLLCALQLSCAGAPLTTLSQLACRRAVVSLKKRVGPELGKVMNQLPIELSKKSFGCALTFTRIDEELPGEVSGIYGQASSEELAIYLPTDQNMGSLTVLSPPPYRTDSVRFELKFLELRDSPPRELIVIEHASRPTSSYKGIQAYTFAEGVPSPREILSQPLRFKTVDGITVTAAWSFMSFEEEQVVLINGGGDYRIFKWHEGLQSFKLDLAASARYKQARSSSP